MQSKGTDRELATRLKMFAVTQPGLENITCRELEDLGLQCKVIEGGVEYTGTIKDLYITNLYLRTANRIIVRIGQFRVTRLPEVIKRFSAYPWELYGIGPERASAPAFRVTCHKSRLYHSGAVEERALKGIEKRVGKFNHEDSSSENPPLVIIRIVRDRCTVSVDSSGMPLHMRGYRIKGTRAPLRENLAAALVLMSAWDMKSPLFDPLCGSGTIAIEAALISRNMAPGLLRDFAFTKWKNFNQELWDGIREEAESNVSDKGAEIYGADIDSRAIEAAIANAARAGVAHSITFKTGRFSLNSAAPCTNPGWVITNPPYGRRISAKRGGKQDIYRELAGALRKNFKNWGITCLAPASRDNPLPGLTTDILSTFTNGGFRVRVAEHCPS